MMARRKQVSLEVAAFRISSMAQSFPASTTGFDAASTSADSTVFAAMNLSNPSSFAPVNRTAIEGLPSIAVLFTGAKRSEEHTSELQSHSDLVCRLLLEKKKKNKKQ